MIWMLDLHQCSNPTRNKVNKYTKSGFADKNLTITKSLFRH